MGLTIPPEYLNHDYGFTAVDEIPVPVVIPNTQGQEQVLRLQESIRALEAIIVPLLANLIKTADSPYIHWPNRKAVCQEHLDKVLALTRSLDATQPPSNQ